MIVAIALILAGAFGNIIDSVFYGVIFDDSHQQVATLFAEKPYGTWLNGQVVDMFYFPFIKDYPMPEWVPYFGGREFTFFNAIFNVADMAISTGVGILIVFNNFPNDGNRFTFFGLGDILHKSTMDKIAWQMHQDIHNTRSQ